MWTLLLVCAFVMAYCAWFFVVIFAIWLVKMEAWRDL
jgi:hypothetical protein